MRRSILSHKVRNKGTAVGWSSAVDSGEGRSRLPKIAIALAVILVMASAIWASGQSNLWDAAVEHESHLKRLVSDNLLFSMITVMALYAVLTSLPIPIASLGSLVAGWLLGFWFGLPAIAVGATLGASLTFFVMRYCFRDLVLGFAGERLTSINRSLQKDGIYYVAILRLVPGIPFFLVNSLLAQTHLSLRAFIAASFVSMLPGTIVHLAAGAALPSLSRLRDEGMQSVISWQLTCALLLLALQPLAFRFVFNLIRRPREANV